MRQLDPETTDFNTVYNQFRWSIPDHLNIAIQVCEYHQSEPDRIAVYYENIDGETAVFSFSQLKTLSDQFANLLRGMGVARGHRVILFSKPKVVIPASEPESCNKGAILNSCQVGGIPPGMTQGAPSRADLNSEG